MCLLLELDPSYSLHEIVISSFYLDVSCNSLELNEKGLVYGSFSRSFCTESPISLYNQAIFSLFYLIYVSFDCLRVLLLLIGSLRNDDREPLLPGHFKLTYPPFVEIEDSSREPFEVIMYECFLHL